MVNYKWPFSIAIYIYRMVSRYPHLRPRLSSYRRPRPLNTVSPATLWPRNFKSSVFFWEPLAKAIIYEYFYVYDIDSCIHRQYIIHTYMSYVIHIYILHYIHTIPDHTRPDHTIPLHTYNIHTYIQTYRHTDIQTDIHTYIHTYIHLSVIRVKRNGQVEMLKMASQVLGALRRRKPLGFCLRFSQILGMLWDIGYFVL